MKTNGNHDISNIEVFSMTSKREPPNDDASSAIKHKHTKNFHFILTVLSCIRKNGKVDIDSLCKLFDLNKHTTQLWLHTLVGIGYIEKTKSGEYAVTERGENELRYHNYPADSQSECVCD